MNPPILDFLWLMPVLPLLAAAVTALMPARAGKAAAWTAILAMAGACVVAWLGLSETLGLWSSGADTRLVHNFDWLVDGASVLRMGWVLDPLSASMCAMVATVSLLIFIFSAGYMADDARMKQFFCFLSLFGAAMLGLVIANSLLLLFMCWELVGLASYLLIGFWFQKPEAAAACRKAFADFAVRRPRTTLLDWRVDRPEMHDSNLFFDHTHYRQPIARLIEADLARAIRALD